MLAVQRARNSFAGAQVAPSTLSPPNSGASREHSFLQHPGRMRSEQLPPFPLTGLLRWVAQRPPAVRLPGHECQCSGQMALLSHVRAQRQQAPISQTGSKLALVPHSHSQLLGGPSCPKRAHKSGREPDGASSSSSLCPRRASFSAHVAA